MQVHTAFLAEVTDSSIPADELALDFLKSRSPERELSGAARVPGHNLQMRTTDMHDLVDYRN